MNLKLFLLFPCILVSTVTYSVPAQLIHMQNKGGRNVLLLSDIHIPYTLSDTHATAEKAEQSFASKDVDVIYETLLENAINEKLRVLNDEFAQFIPLPESGGFLTDLKNLMASSYPEANKCAEIRTYTIYVGWVQVLINYLPMLYSESVVKTAEERSLLEKLKDSPFCFDDIIAQLESSIEKGRGLIAEIKDEGIRNDFYKRIDQLKKEIVEFTTILDQFLGTRRYGLKNGRTMPLGRLIDSYLRQKNEASLLIVALFTMFSSSIPFNSAFLLDINILRLLDQTTKAAVVCAGAEHTQALVGLLERMGYTIVHKTRLVWQEQEYEFEDYKKRIIEVTLKEQARFEQLEAQQNTKIKFKDAIATGQQFACKPIADKEWEYISSLLPRASYPSQVSNEKTDCPKGRCLSSTGSLPSGTIVEKFEGIPTHLAYKAGMDKPIENRHIKWIGRDKEGKDLWIFVTSKAAYINHSCNPNCIVNNKRELVTVREVKKGEELTISYNSRSKNNFPSDLKWQPEWNFTCFCEAHNCLKFINRFID